jgi:hypothetical protein
MTSTQNCDQDAEPIELPPRPPPPLAPDSSAAALLPPVAEAMAAEPFVRMRLAFIEAGIEAPLL